MVPIDVNEYVEPVLGLGRTSEVTVGTHDGLRAPHRPGRRRDGAPRALRRCRHRPTPHVVGDGQAMDFNAVKITEGGLTICQTSVPGPTLPARRIGPEALKPSA